MGHGASRSSCSSQHGHLEPWDLVPSPEALGWQLIQSLDQCQVWHCQWLLVTPGGHLSEKLVFSLLKPGSQLFHHFL